MKRKPRDPYRRTGVQFSVNIQRDVADLIRSQAAARGQTIVSLVEASVRAYCGSAPDATETDKP